jgi:hypothetical protein
MLCQIIFFVNPLENRKGGFPHSGRQPRGNLPLLFKHSESMREWTSSYLQCQPTRGGLRRWVAGWDGARLVPEAAPVEAQT